MNNSTLEYTGELEYQPKPDPKSNDLNKRRLSPYIADKNLVEAVNLAIYLQRPLLLEGEPGCGKTLLARAIAYEFGQRLNIKNYPYFSWNIKSTSRAKEGLYTYDAVGRLRDAQLVGTDSYKNYLTPEETTKLFSRIQKHNSYIKLGVLGKAFIQKKYRPIVLIDEIDKADIDFPNDLLLELEEKKFEITEIPTTIEATQPPITIVTSNSEKELPDAFLRRCIFYYLEFPDEDTLIDIVNAHFSENLPRELVEEAIAQFIELRENGASRQDGKKASTSELLDLIRLLNRYPPEKALKIIDSLDENPALLGVLLKSKQDQDFYQRSIDEY